MGRRHFLPHRPGFYFTRFFEVKINNVGWNSSYIFTCVFSNEINTYVISQKYSCPATCVKTTNLLNLLFNSRKDSSIFANSTKIHTRDVIFGVLRPQWAHFQNRMNQFSWENLILKIKLVRSQISTKTAQKIALNSTKTVSGTPHEKGDQWGCKTPQITSRVWIVVEFGKILLSFRQKPHKN